MNTTEACNLLGVKPGDSMDEVDKAFRKLAVKHHPDKNPNNKEESEATFKKINEAHQFLKKYGTKAQAQPNFGSFNNINDIFNEIFRRQQQETSRKHNQQKHQYYYHNPYHNPFVDHPFTSDPFSDFSEPWSSSSYQEEVINISFEESINGCNKEISTLHEKLCTTCKGEKFHLKKTDKTCTKCDGKGYRDISGSNLPCNGCRTSGFETERNPCQKCNGSGVESVNVKMPIYIRPGINSGEYMSFNRKRIKILVNSDKDMTKNGNDVISNIELTLLEALKGTTKQIRTVHGEKSLKIPPKVRNKDSIRIKGFGVKGTFGCHIFNVTVNYPTNVEEIIKVLENKEADGV